MSEDKNLPEKRIKITDLSKDHQVFVINYLKLNNATKAYMAAYPKAKYDSASVNGSKLLVHAKVSQYLKQHFSDMWESREEKIGQTLDNLLNVANSDIANVIEIVDGNVEVKDLDKIDSSVIQSIQQTKTDTKFGEQRATIVKLHDKSKATAELVRVLGMIKDKMEPVNVVIEVIPAVRPQIKKTDNEDEE